MRNHLKKKYSLKLIREYLDLISESTTKIRLLHSIIPYDYLAFL